MTSAFPIRSLIYTSDARPELHSADLDRIHATAVSLNALDGITGLLVFNGSGFLQIIEGTGEAIADLVGRLRRDPRHTNFWVRADAIVSAKSFPDWSMELVKVSVGRFQAREDLESLLPAGVLDAIRPKLIDALDEISAP